MSNIFPYMERDEWHPQPFVLFKVETVFRWNWRVPKLSSRVQEPRHVCIRPEISDSYIVEGLDIYSVPLQYECRRIEKFGISSDSCSEDRQFKSVSCNYYPLLRWNLERKVCIVIKTITKEGIQSLIDKKILKPYSGGYMNSRGYHVGYYKTCGNKRYIEDWYADKAEKLK